MSRSWASLLLPARRPRATTLKRRASALIWACAACGRGNLIVRSAVDMLRSVDGLVLAYDANDHLVVGGDLDRGAESGEVQHVAHGVEILVAHLECERIERRMDERLHAFACRRAGLGAGAAVHAAHGLSAHGRDLAGIAVAGHAATPQAHGVGLTHGASFRAV